MLNLIIGSVGCGKTTYVHKLLGERAAAGEEDLLLIVPEQFTYESELGVLRLLGSRDACRVNIFSFSRLYDYVSSKVGGVRIPQPNASGKAVMMSLAIEGIADKLSVYSRHRDSIALVSNMLAMVDELKQCAVSADMLRSAASEMPDSLLKRKSSEIALVYDAFDAMVSSSSFDSKEPMERLSELLCENELFMGKTVVIDGFRRFSAQELKVIGELLKRAKDVFVTLCTDSVSGDSHEVCAFSGIRQTARRLVSLANRVNVPVSKPIKLTDELMGFSTYGHEALRHLERSVYNPVAEPYSEPCDCLTVCCAPTAEQECAWVARTIRGLMRSGEYRCKDIAVIYRTAELYEQELTNALKKYGVPMFEDKRQPVMNQPLIVLVSSALSVCHGGFQTDNIMRYIKTSLAGLSTEEWSLLENYVLLWDINGQQWLSDWTANPDGYGVEMNEKREGLLAQINSHREKIVSPLVKLKESLEEKTIKGFCEEVYRFLVDTQVDKSLLRLAVELEENGEQALALEQQQVWELLIEQLDQMASAAGDYTVTPKRFSELFALSMNSCTLGRIPTGFDETFIGSAPRIQTRVPKVVFAVGMNEGVFPQHPTIAGLFTDNERILLEKYSLEMADNSRKMILDERFVVYNSLCSARQRLYVSYVCADVRGKSMEPSEVVTMIEHLFPHCNRVNVAETPETAYIESHESAFELLSSLWRQGGALSASLKEYFAGREEYSGKLSALKRAADKQPFTIKNEETAKRLFGSDMRLSASRIEVYESCPFEYFCKYGLYAKPRQLARLDPAQSGTVIHYVLEKLLSRYGGKGLSALEDSDLEKYTAELLEEYARQFLGGMDNKSKRFIYLYSRLYKTLLVIVKRLKTEFAGDQFEPCDFELEIGDRGKVPSYVVPLENGGSVSVHGFVDRVDMMEQEGKRYIRVVDYKTGTKDFALSDVLNGLNMQMLVYLMSLWRMGQDYYGGELVPAGVLYLPARFMPFDVKREATEESIDSMLLSSGKMSGMILDEAAVINGMDAQGEGMFIPLKKDRKGNVTGNLIDLVHMGKLAERMDSILKELAKGLHSGRIPAKPVHGKNHDTTCDYCDYKSVCGHESDDDYRYIGFLSHGECLEELEGKEDDYGETIHS